MQLPSALIEWQTGALGGESTPTLRPYLTAGWSRINGDGPNKAPLLMSEARLRVLQLPEPADPQLRARPSGADRQREPQQQAVLRERPHNNPATTSPERPDLHTHAHYGEAYAESGSLDRAFAGLVDSIEPDLTAPGPPTDLAREYSR